jgi:WD40-like Beta Propeller Repeat
MRRTPGPGSAYRTSGRRTAGLAGLAALTALTVLTVLTVLSTSLTAAAQAASAAPAAQAAGAVRSAQAAYPGVDGQIAFVHGGNIYTIEPNGSGLTRLTSGGRHAGPRWSPDGKQIAYVYRGNLWIMGASGGDKTKITHAAPGYTDARPSWSPNGRYLAFVRTRHSHRYGYLTRYDTVRHRFAIFSTPYQSESPTVRQVKVTALPSAVAWGWALNATGVTYGSFIIFEGAGAQCPTPYKYCLDALGFSHQDQYKNGFPSAEDLHKRPIRLLDPDWFPITPEFGTDVLTTQENCAGGTCADAGIDLGIGATTALPGAYQAVYSPQGRQIAYVRNVRGTAEIYVGFNRASPGGTLLTAGSQPDWQPR